MKVGPTSISSCFLLIALGYCLLCVSCTKEEFTSLPLQQITSPVADQLESICLTSNQEIHIVGGETWLRGISLYSNDGGQSWDTDSIAAATLFDLDLSTDGYLHTTGIGGRLHRHMGDGEWTFAGFLPIGLHRSLSFYDINNGVAVGGQAYQDGRIFHFGEQYEWTAADSFANELSCVAFSDAQTVHAAGYGLVIRSTDGGQNWTTLDVTGEFFQDITFPSAEVGYLVGLSGSILKTKDGGLNWSVQRDGDKVSVSDQAFRAVFFLDEQRGWIVGDGGVFWMTDNGGADWKRVEDTPDVDFRDVHVRGTTGWIVGEAGSIFTFSL